MRTLSPWPFQSLFDCKLCCYRRDNPNMKHLMQGAYTWCVHCSCLLYLNSTIRLLSSQHARLHLHVSLWLLPDCCKHQLLYVHSIRLGFVQLMGCIPCMHYTYQRICACTHVSVLGRTEAQQLNQDRHIGRSLVCLSASNVMLRLCREWMQTNDARAQEFSQHAHYIQPTPTKAALGHSRHAGSQDSAGKSAHATAVQNFKLSKFVHHAKHKVDDSKPGIMDTIRPVRDVRINGQTQAALVV